MTFIRKVTSVQSQRISYFDNERQGRETLLLLHGLAGDSSFWRYNIPFWDSQGFRVIAVDMHGTDIQTAPQKNSVSYLARIICAFMQDLNLSCCHIVGHSMGGQIAVFMAYWHPDRVKSLHLIAPAGFEYFSRQEIEYLVPKLTPEFALTAFTNRIMSITYHFHQWRSEWEWFHDLHRKYFTQVCGYASQIAAFMRNMLYEPVYDILPWISVPTQVLSGQRDNLIPNFFIHQQTTQEIMEIGTRKIQQGRLILFENMGHNLMIENSDAVNRQIAYFIKYQL
ncbi:MAG: alpha/beta hydrolase [Bacteroidia bacterium]|nr:alpha/beta hydrolase [Bacteroidia bacterium]MDW8347598.1 alpha/beta hydrolase [Bacteroidia bacterium]